MNRIAAIMLVAALAAPAAMADDKHHTGGLPDGEIRIQNLDMPAMTMVFQVKDPGVLDQLKAGDKVKFQAENGS